MPERVRSPELDGAVVVGFPLAGEWTAVQSPGSRVPSHGTDMLGQRYAFDFIRLSARTRRYHEASAVHLLLAGVPTCECLGWDEPVLAVLDGVVVAAVDGVPERERVHPVLEALRVLRTGLAFRPTPERIAGLLGNHVVVRTGDLHAVFAHLRPGSVEVAIGQRVRAGEALGRLGHTGNSTSPHLHFQLMDRADPLTARGVPCRFEAYEVLRGDGWARVEGGIPTTDERIRSVPVHDAG
jgi:Peptidase family M23